MKKAFVLVFAAVLAIMVIGCTGKGSAKSSGPKAISDIHIGFVGMTLNNEFHVTLANGAREKAKELGVKIDVQAGDQHASTDQQLTIIENMLANNVDGIIIVPSSSEGLESALRKCQEKKLPVINADTRLNATIVRNVGMEIPFYGTNNYEGAKLAGQYAAKNMPAGCITAILTGIEGHQNTSDRLNGFKDGAGSAIKVVAEQTANWEVDQGYTAAQNIISANPNLQLFFCSNDNMGIGALRAVQEARKQNQIKIIGFDAVSEALNLVESGEFMCTVAQYPAEMGILSVENLVKWIRGEPYEKEIDTGCKVITKDNVNEHKKYTARFVY